MRAGRNPPSPLRLSPSAKTRSAEGRDPGGHGRRDPMQATRPRRTGGLRFMRPGDHERFSRSRSQLHRHSHLRVMSAYADFQGPQRPGSGPVPLEGTTGRRTGALVPRAGFVPCAVRGPQRDRTRPRLPCRPGSVWPRPSVSAYGTEPYVHLFLGSRPSRPRSFANAYQVVDGCCASGEEECSVRRTRIRGRTRAKRDRLPTADRSNLYRSPVSSRCRRTTGACRPVRSTSFLMSSGVTCPATAPMWSMARV